MAVRPRRLHRVEDAREVYWDPDATSPFNGKPGRYVATFGRPAVPG